MNIIGRRKLWFLFSGTIIVLSLLAIFFWGLRLGVDFRGGSLLEVAFESQVTAEQIKEAVTPLHLGNLTVQPTDRQTYILRMETIEPVRLEELLGALTKLGQVEERNFSSVGPTIGQELKRRAVLAVVLASLAIIFYLALSFRKVPKPVTSWRFGLIAVITLLHDVLIVVGAFALLGQFFGGFEIDSLFVVALLTVMGFSVHDTIVVFDRIRENLRMRVGEHFEQVVNTSVVETIARSLNTSLTVVLVLLSLYLLGGVSTKNFVLALVIGITFGTYSSIFIASPLLVVWQEIIERRRKFDEQ
jgi:preprotein translocase subunit SecF